MNIGSRQLGENGEARTRTHTAPISSASFTNAFSILDPMAFLLSSTYCSLEPCFPPFKSDFSPKPRTLDQSSLIVQGKLIKRVGKYLRSLKTNCAAKGCLKTRKTRQLMLYIAFTYYERHAEFRNPCEAPRVQATFVCASRFDCLPWYIILQRHRAFTCSQQHKWLKLGLTIECSTGQF